MDAQDQNQDQDQDQDQDQTRTRPVLTIGTILSDRIQQLVSRPILVKLGKSPSERMNWFPEKLV